jgi:hypothetical protein
MRAEIQTCIRILIESDASVTPEHRREILKVCGRDPSRRRRTLGTIREAAERFGCCPRTVERYASQGLLKPIRYSPRKIRYDMDEVEELVERGMNSVES